MSKGVFTILLDPMNPIAKCILYDEEIEAQLRPVQCVSLLCVFHWVWQPKLGPFKSFGNPTVTPNLSRYFHLHCLKSDLVH